MLSKESEGKARSVLDFASHLETALNNEANLSAKDFPDFSVYFASLPLQRKDLSSDQQIAFDRKGVALWNKCCSLGKYNEETALVNIAKVQALSYFLLESAAHGKRKDQTRLLKTALKISKKCLDTNLLDVAVKILEHLAAKQEYLLSDTEQKISENENVKDHLRIQYLLLRITLAWKQDRLDLAKHFHDQIQKLVNTLHAEQLEELIDLCYEVGNDQLNKNQAKLAADWLNRGYQLLKKEAANIGDADFTDLRLSLLHTYVRALLASEDPEDGAEASKVLNELSEEFPHKLWVILLRLEQYTKDPGAHADAFRVELIKIVRCVHLNHSNHKLVLHYVHHLKSLSLIDSIQALEVYIATRLAPNDEEGWTESAIITLLWLMTSEISDDDELNPASFKQSLDNIHRVWGKVLSSEATHGALVLLWTQIEKAPKQKSRHRTIEWCQLALQQMFSNAGDHNIGKIERKIVKCYIDLSDLDAARASFDAMSQPRKQHPLSRFLRYSLALRRGDEPEIQSALVALATAHDDRNKLLFAAVSEAMQHGSKLQGAFLLQRILDKHRGNLPAELDGFALLRCTAQLLLSALQEQSAIDEELLARLCEVFKSASLLTQKQQNHRRHESKYHLQECIWFEKNSYNAAVQHLKTWPVRYLVDLLHFSCLVQYPACAVQPARQDKLVHEINAGYIRAILCIVEARRMPPLRSIEDMPRTTFDSKSPPSPAEIRSVLYKAVFDQYTTIRRTFETTLGLDKADPNTANAANDVIQKMIVLAPLAFEALLFINTSAGSTVPGEGLPVNDEMSLNQVIDHTMTLKPPLKTYSIFADMILSASTPSTSAPGQDQSKLPTLTSSAAVNLLAKLVSGLRNQPNYDASQAAKWIRCMIQVILDRLEASAQVENTKPDKKSFTTLAKLLDHALLFARSKTASYPAEELQWLATMLFNMAIDLYRSFPDAGLDAASTEGAAKADASATSHKSTSMGRNDDLATPQFWAKKAVEFADVLGLATDDQNLVTMLRERCQRFKWDV